MTTQIQTIVLNARCLWIFRENFPCDLPCDVHCSNCGSPEIVFHAKHVEQVMATYGPDGWDRPLNALRHYDRVKTLHGVRLVIRSAETVPEPQPEGPIPSIKTTTDLCQTPS